MISGIEAINIYGAKAYIDVRSLFQARGLDLKRFDNLMMNKKSVALPCEDPVTNAVNAAKPIIDSLTEEEKNRIELVITASESGLDFGKAMTSYIQDYLGLSRNCRTFEVKHACYGGTAALQMANSFIVSEASQGAKALVIATDTARVAVKMTYAEPSQGSGAAAILVSETPAVLEIDHGAAGYYSYEVMDTFRPNDEIEIGDADLSLLSYLECLDNCFKAYSEKVEGSDFQKTFRFLAFHTPFAGMVKGAHRKMMRQYVRATPAQIEDDFQKRVSPSLRYCEQVGNTYSAALYFALCGLIDHADINDYERIGLFSYGSGCSSEFYSGIIKPSSKSALAKMNIRDKLEDRYALTIEEYDRLIDLNREWGFGIKDKVMNYKDFAQIYETNFRDRHLLALKRIENYHREYEWV